MTSPGFGHQNYTAPSNMKWHPQPLPTPSMHFTTNFSASDVMNHKLDACTLAEITTLLKRGLPIFRRPSSEMSWVFCTISLRLYMQLLLIAGALSNWQDTSAPAIPLNSMRNLVAINWLNIVSAWCSPFAGNSQCLRGRTWLSCHVNCNRNHQNNAAK